MCLSSSPEPEAATPRTDLGTKRSAYDDYDKDTSDVGSRDSGPGCRIGVWNRSPQSVMTSRAQLVTDEDLVRRFQETGETECFGELFVRYRKMVFGSCYGFFSVSQSAEDATQETFLRAYRNIDSFQGGDFTAWLMRIARNVCIDEWRRRRPEARAVEIDTVELPAEGSADSSFQARSLIERVWREIKALAPAQRKCLELKVQGYSYEETAALTGLSIDSVKSNLQNGRRMLWKKIEGTLTQSR